MPRKEQEKIQEDSDSVDGDEVQSKLSGAIEVALYEMNDADKKGEIILPKLLKNGKAAKRDKLYKEAIDAYHRAFEACARVRDIDNQCFTSIWFRNFYQRNYNALMIKSVYDNVIDNVDDVRYW
jgi:hypothetical protein